MKGFTEEHMDEKVRAYIEKYPKEIVDMYFGLRSLVFDNAPSIPKETLWAGMPSYYVGDAFVRLIPFKDHINVEARAALSCKDELEGYKITPKGMIQIYIDQKIPNEALREVFLQTLK